MLKLTKRFLTSSRNDFDAKELLTIQFFDESADKTKFENRYIGMIKNTDNGFLS